MNIVVPLSVEENLLDRDGFAFVSARLGDAEKSKLDLHVESVRDLERRLKSPTSPIGGAPASCGTPHVDMAGVDDSALTDPAHFPAILRAQVDTMVLAMACGLTRVGVVQASQRRIMAKRAARSLPITFSSTVGSRANLPI